jgi:uncharacterized protein (DUF934 family)
MKFIDPLHDAWSNTADHCLFSLDDWLARRAGAAVDGDAQRALGVMLANDQDVESLQPHLDRIALVVLQFPKWTDGRAYSQARLLRTRLRYAGEIRASGEVLVDMLPLLQRTGFDAVELRADQSLESAQRALRFFAGHYQGDTVEPQPLFGRVDAAGTGIPNVSH